MTIQTPCEVGDTLYLRCEKGTVAAKVIGMKVTLSDKGVQTKIQIYGVFGKRQYDSSLLGKKIFKEAVR